VITPLSGAQREMELAFKRADEIT